MLDIEVMVSLLRRAHSLPHSSAADVFMTAGLMAEAIEGASPSKAKPTSGVRPSILTTKRLRELGLEYETVGDCAWDLVVVKKMTHEQAAKRMGATVQQVNAGVLNYKIRHGLNKKATEEKP